MDLSEILALLESENTQKALAGDNPYVGALAIPNAIQIQPGRYGTGQEIGANFIKGLLGGGLENLAEGYQQKLKDEFGQAIISSALGLKAEPNRLSKSLFKKGADTGSLFRVKAAESAQARKQKLEDELALKKFGKIAEILGENEAYQMMDEQPIASAADDTPQTKIEVPNKPGAGSAASLLSPRGKEEYSRNRDLEKFREEFLGGVRKADEYTNYRERVEATKSLAQAMSDPSKASDMEFVFGIMKILDPRSVVRGDEQESVKRIAPLLSQYANKVSSVVNGTGELDEATRKGLLRLAARKVDTSRDTYLSFRKEREGAAQRNNFGDVSDIFFLPEGGSKELFSQFNIDLSPNSGGAGRLSEIKAEIDSGNLSADQILALQEEAKQIAKQMGLGVGVGASGRF